MTAQPTILVVDDEPEIVELMRDFLEAANFRVMTAASGEDALPIVQRGGIACILLDVMMPGISGFETLRHIREFSDAPVLFLSARQGDADKIRGLGLGADDYIVKSATPGEVVARIKAVLRRSGHGVPAPIISAGRLTIDLTAREIRIDRDVISFTPREFDLLALLASNPRRAFSRDELFERLWGLYGDRHTVTVHIARLREKIEEDPTNPRLLITVRGMGYRFEGERS